ncbi:peptidase inhibitor family I36 protein (plasmid) [Streptomyces sp. NBC_00984]|uniref:peptidase inhibitor family I36 protein n=1 Tax=Streptomyces sp. NBC_00984 TaxID=2903700 RepID=UPI002F91791E|nr:peptidase inhibitor family I36 protein [Streptomyces sp. NBC_00984]
MRKFWPMVAVGMAAASLPVAAPQTTAAQELCPPGKFCLFENSNGRGHWASYTSATADVRRQGLTAARADLNASKHAWCLWSQPNYKGTKKVLPPSNQGLHNLGGAFLSAASVSTPLC